MFRRDKPINLKGSTSSLCNNLAVYVMPDKRQLSYAVVHKSVINIACAAADGTSVTGRQVICKEPSATQGLPFVMQAKWVAYPSRTILVLTTQKSIQIYEQDGSALIFWHSLSDSLDKSNYGKGIAGLGNGTLCVGTEEGIILVFDVPSKGTNVTLAESVHGHKAPVCDIASQGDQVASGDGVGNIIVWRSSGSTLTQVTSIRGGGWPCNSIALWNGVVVGGYASGHIRVFNASNGKIGAEVTAHARAVNALDVSSENGMMVSVSDDTFFRVWQLKAAHVPQIEFRHGECVTDLQLVGGCFVDGQGRALCISGYDSNEVSFYIRS